MASGMRPNTITSRATSGASAAILAIEKQFGVKIGSSEESRQALASVSALAAYLRSRPTSP